MDAQQQGASWLDRFDRAGYNTFAPGWPGDADTADATRGNRPLLRRSIAQQLLGSGLASAGVAIAPAQFRGVFTSPLAQVRSVLPVLSRPWLRTQRRGRTRRRAITASSPSEIPRRESDNLFAAQQHPRPRQPIFQAGVANFAPHSEASVDTKSARGPLLLLAGGRDRTVPEATVRSAYRIQPKNLGVTALTVFSDRGHAMPVDLSWREIADTALDFLAE